MSLPINSAVTTASSATGMSLGPAETTAMVPLPYFFRSRHRTTARASSRYSALGAFFFTAANCCGLVRVARMLPPCFANREKIWATCAGVFPSPKITSGIPARRARWWSTLAKPRSSNGKCRRRATPSSGESLPLRTSSKILRMASAFMEHHRNITAEEDYAVAMPLGWCSYPRQPTSSAISVGDRRELFERLAFYGQVAGKLLSPDHLHRAELKTTCATRCGSSCLQATRRRAQLRACVPPVRHPRQIPHEVLGRTPLRGLDITLSSRSTPAHARRYEHKIARGIFGPPQAPASLGKRDAGSV